MSAQGQGRYKVLATTTITFNYHDELETTTGKTGPESFTSKHLDFFLCKNVKLGSFYHFHRKMVSNSI